MIEWMKRKVCEAHAERIFDEGDSAVGWFCAAIGAVALLEWVTR